MSEAAHWKISEVSGVYLTALCAWREARGCPPEAIRGVLHVIRNRALAPSWWGRDGYVSVILKPQQFSSFNPTDPNSTKFPGADDPVFAKILELTEAVMQGQDDDLTGGATHYESATVAPSWAASMIQTANIGPFRFYR